MAGTLVTSQRSQETGELPEPEQLLSFRVSILSKLLDRRLARLVGDEFGLAAAEYQVLAQILLHPKSTVRGVAARTYVDKAQVSRAVAVLEDQGLIERSVVSADRRSPVFTATADGRALAGEILPLRRQHEDDLVASLDGVELATVLAALDKLIARVAPPPPGRRAEPAAAQRRRSIRAARGAIRAAREAAVPGRAS
jgi:DNA-binding MarR family transcriptional regulator